MKNFTYYRPHSIKQAAALLDTHWGTTELLAGGTDLHDLQKQYIAQPDKVVSLNGVAVGEKDKPQSNPGILLASGDHITLGALVTLDRIAQDKDLQKEVPALTTAAGLIGGPQLRNVGTLGGNLCQRNRCWYFRDEQVPCLLKGGEKCYALDGENRYHAVFAQGHKCVIVNPSTLAPVLLALDAGVHVLGPKGERSIALAKFFQAPTGPDQREHVLAPNEIVLKVTFRRGPRNASYEVRHKQSYDWPLVQAVAAFKLDGGKAKDVRIVLGHVAPTPHVAHAAAKALEGKEVTEETATAAGKAATEGARPLSQTHYKIKLIEVAVKRAILTAAGHKKYWEV